MTHLIIPEPRLMVILGMHRSGTSALTGGLSTVLGVDLGDNLMKSNPDVNAKGFFEDLAIFELNESILRSLNANWHSLALLSPSAVSELSHSVFFDQAVSLMQAKLASASAIVGFKDPRTAKLLPFWQEVFLACHIEPTYVLAVRNPMDVAESLSTRDGFAVVKSGLLWLQHLLQSLVLSADKPRILVDFDDLLADPAGQMTLLADRLQLSVDEAALHTYATEFLEQGLRHHRHTLAELLTSDCLPLIKEVYAGVLDYIRRGQPLHDAEFHQHCLVWWAELQRMAPAWQWMDEVCQSEALLKQQQDAQAAVIKRAMQQAIQIEPGALKSVFDGSAYLQRNADVLAARLDPYEHFVADGLHEGRPISEQPLNTLTMAWGNALTHHRDVMRHYDVFLARNHEERMAQTEHVQQLHEQLGAQMASISALESQLSESLLAKDVQQTTVQQLHEQLGAQQTNIAALESELFAARLSMDAQHERYVAEMAALQNQLADSQNKLSGLAEQFNEARMASAEQIAGLTLTYETDLAARQQLIEDLQVMLNRERQSVADLTQAIEFEKNRLVDLRTVYAAKDEILRNQLEELRKQADIERNGYQAALQQAQQALSALQQEVENIQSWRGYRLLARMNCKR